MAEISFVSAWLLQSWISIWTVSQESPCHEFQRLTVVIYCFPVSWLASFLLYNCNTTRQLQPAHGLYWCRGEGSRYCALDVLPAEGNSVQVMLKILADTTGVRLHGTRPPEGFGFKVQSLDLGMPGTKYTGMVRNGKNSWQNTMNTFIMKHTGDLLFIFGVILRQYVGLWPKVTLNRLIQRIGFFQIHIKENIKCSLSIGTMQQLEYGFL